MSTFDLYGDDQSIPFVVDVTEKDAERIEMALDAVSILSEANELSSSIRSNPTYSAPLSSYLDDIENNITRIVGYLPATGKEAMSILKKEGKNREIGKIMELYKNRKVGQIAEFSNSIAESFSSLSEVEFDVLIDSGVVAALIAARYKRFEKLLDQCRTIQFEDLKDKDQKFITYLVEATDVFFDVTVESEVSGFEVSGYKETLVLFKSDALVARIMEILSATHVENRMPSSHYAEPFLRLVYIATEIDDDLDSWMKSPKEGKSLNSAFDFFPSIGSLVLTSRDCKELCQKLQANSMFAPALKLVINLFLQKKDGAEYFDNKRVLKSIVGLNIISKERANTLINKTAQIAYFAMAISASPEYTQIIDRNYSQFSTAKEMIKGILPTLGVASASSPSVAYDYATLANAQDFDNYFHWSINLLASFYNQKNFSGVWYSPTKELLNKLMKSKTLRNEICDFIRYMRKEKAGKHGYGEDAHFRGGFWIGNAVYVHPSQLESLDEIVKMVDFNLIGGHSQKHPTSQPIQEWVDNLREAGFGKAYDTLFPNGVFYNDSGLHMLLVGCTLVKNFEKVDKSLRFQSIKASTPQDFEVYHSSPLNPLSLIMGHPDFYNCCFTIGLQGGAAALASYFTYDYAGVCTFGFDVEDANGVKYDVMCGAFTSLVKAKFTGENIYVPQEIAVNMIEGATQLSLQYVNPKMSKASSAFSYDSDAEDVELYALGGSERPRYDLKQKSFYDDSAVSLIQALSTNRKYIQNVGSARFKGMKPSMENADNKEKYTFSIDDLKETPYYDELKNASFKSVEPIAKAYAEVFPGAEGVWTAAGIQNIKSASLSFKEVHVHFGDIGGSFEVVYVTEDDEEIEMPKIDNFNYLLYMFSFPKGDSFVPFQGSVHFYTDVDTDYCKKLLIPDWFKGKPLKRGNKVLKTKDLVKMRTPLEGAFVENSKGKITRIL